MLEGPVLGESSKKGKEPTIELEIKINLFDDLDHILTDYANNGRERIVDVEAAVDDVVDGDMVDETKMVIDMANFTEVKGDKENEIEEDGESETEVNVVSGREA